MQISKIIFALFAVAYIVSVASAAPSKSVKVQIALRALQVTNTSTDMMSGIIDGMSVVAGKPQLCSKAHKDASNNFVEGSKAMANAFTNPGIVGVQQFEMALRLYGNGFISVADSLEFCGLNTIVSNWTAVANQIRQDPGRGVANLMNAMADRIQRLHLSTLIREINDDLNNGLQYAAGVKIGTIIATMLTPNVPPMNFLTFLRTLTQLMFLMRS